MNYYKKIINDFSFIASYGFEYDHIEHHYVVPSVVFLGKDGKNIQIGFSHEDDRMFVRVYRNSGCIIGEDILENISFSSNRYADQVGLAKKIFTDYLEKVQDESRKLQDYLKKEQDYLNSKDKRNYNNLDRIFELYLNGNVKMLLSNYSGVGIYPAFNEFGRTIQLIYNYYNIHVIVNFLEDKYNVAIYNSSIEVEEIEKLFTEYDYRNDFSLEELINIIDIDIKSHPSLMDKNRIDKMMSEAAPTIKKKNLYILISLISLCLPCVIGCSLALYYLITKNSIQLNKWFVIFFTLISIILWLVFDAKSKRLK